jgi:GT2 family glycosyltransferase/glycosyltransferase involved in cell wall biosynthesis
MKRILLWVVLLPLQLFLLVVFALVEGLRAAAVMVQPKSDPVEPLTDPSATIVVLNWNGRHLLEECIPALERAVRYAGGGHQILVVDNGSSDESVEWIQAHHPEVDLLRFPENLGFSEGNNKGVEAAAHPVVVLLNNDMIVSEDFLNPLLEGFVDPQVFAVSAQVDFPPGRPREETGQTEGHFRQGFLHLAHAPIRPYHYTRKRTPVLWGGGGSTAFRRDRFLQLGGFSSLFSPCYFEDTDLSYRAWRRGWKVFLAADSRVLHKHRSSTSRRFSADELSLVVEERRLWYIWRNFQLRTLAPHLLMFPLSLNKWAPPAAYLRALKRIPTVLRLRMQEPRRAFSDREILSWARRPFLFFQRFQPRQSEVRRPRGEPLRLLVVSAYLPHLGTHGGAGRVFQLLKRVAKDYDVTLLTFLEDETDRRFLHQAEAVCRRVETVLRRRYLPLSWFPYEPFEEFNVNGMREKIEELLCEEDYDLVHFEWTQMALYAELFRGIPRLMTEIEVNYAAHRTLLDVEENPLRKMRLYYNTLQTLYREVEMCRQVDHVICVTGEDRGYLEGYVPSGALEVVNTGVDTAAFAYTESRQEPNSLVFVGAFRHSPNLDAMDFFTREIFPGVLAEIPETHLYIVGSSPPPGIRRLAKHPNITVTGYVEDIREYYERASVVVVPLRTGVGIRGKILEGWAVGKAMVATSLACQGIEAVHGENILIADEPREFILWTVALQRNPDFCRHLGERGRRTAEALYDWDILGHQMSALYRKAVEQRDEAVHG